MGDDVLKRLDALSVGLIKAKTEEATVKAKRIAIEEEIANLVRTADKGQKTVRLPSGWGVTVKRGFNYRASSGEIASLMQRWANAPEGTPPLPVKQKFELDEKGYEWYRKEHPQLFAVLAEYVTVTPKKISVSLKSPKENK